MPARSGTAQRGLVSQQSQVRAAVRYLLKGTAGGARGDIVQEIIMIVRNVATGESSHSLDDGLPDPFDDAPGG